MSGIRATVGSFGQPSQTARGGREVILLFLASSHLVGYTQPPWCTDSPEAAASCSWHTHSKLHHVPWAAELRSAAGAPLMTILAALSIMASMAASFPFLVPGSMASSSTGRFQGLSLHYFLETASQKQVAGRCLKGAEVQLILVFGGSFKHSCTVRFLCI